MDSGLGSDEDRKARTKEQKQLRNQQLVSGCFIDAASLSDEGEIASNERRQGALLFNTSLPHFPMRPNAPPDDSATPYNSIQFEEACKSPLGFYVDLNDVRAPEAPAAHSKKNIFSMVFDFEAPKTVKPCKLSSSLVSYKKSAKTRGLTLAVRSNANSSLSSSVSSISSVAGPSRMVDEGETGRKLSLSSKSSSSSSEEEATLERNDVLKAVDSTETVRNGGESFEVEKKEEEIAPKIEEEKPQFVRLSDLEPQKPRIEVPFTPRMSRSIPESSWVENPILMSRSAGYRSAPHPLEPSSDELSDSDMPSPPSNNKKISPNSVRRLGTDLLRMFLEEIGPDVVVEVDGHRLKAHKCILASRCQYFAALISGNWLEREGNVIYMEGFSYESVYFALLHIYSGAAHVPTSISLPELASLSSLLGLEGLKEVVQSSLRSRHCHHFHRPCAGCCTGVLEVLPLAAAYSLDDLYHACLAWITAHFVQIWPQRQFAAMPRELREKCYQQHVVNLSAESVLTVLGDCDKLLTNLGAEQRGHWSESISLLVVQLIEACHSYERKHFGAVLASKAFVGLDKGGGWRVGQVEEGLVGVANGLVLEQACKSYARIWRLIGEGGWSRAFGDLLEKIREGIEKCLVGMGERLMRSNAWLRLDAGLRSRIKDLQPSKEPPSRLPRAIPPKPSKTIQKTRRPPNVTQSSSDSSRNSSPSINQPSGTSPSLRRSLLLAARAPQVPPSPLTTRKSTLTKPTASSAAKSATNSVIIKPANTQTKEISRSVNKGATPGKKMAQVQKKPPSRSSSPLNNNRNRVASPVKAEVRRSLPRRAEVGKNTVAVKKTASAVNKRKEVVEEAVVKPAMHRSSTFLIEEPTVVGKIVH